MTFFTPEMIAEVRARCELASSVSADQFIVALNDIETLLARDWINCEDLFVTPSQGSGWYPVLLNKEVGLLWWDDKEKEWEEYDFVPWRVTHFLDVKLPEVK